MGFERKTLLGMVALATASCATPSSVNQFDSNRTAQVREVASLTRDTMIPVWRASNGSGVELAVIIEGSTMYEVMTGSGNLSISTCVTDAEVISETPHCAGDQESIFDGDMDGNADVYAARIGDQVHYMDGTAQGVQQRYHQRLDELTRIRESRIRPRV
jgi:hypothetical protein